MGSVGAFPFPEKGRVMDATDEDCMCAECVRPISDAQVDAALCSWFGIAAGWNDKTRSAMRAVLEAARDAS